MEMEPLRRLATGGVALLVRRSARGGALEMGEVERCRPSGRPDVIAGDGVSCYSSDRLRLRLSRSEICKQSQ